MNEPKVCWFCHEPATKTFTWHATTRTASVHMCNDPDHLWKPTAGLDGAWLTIEHDDQQGDPE